MINGYNWIKLKIEVLKYGKKKRKKNTEIFKNNLHKLFNIEHSNALNIIKINEDKLF